MLSADERATRDPRPHLGRSPQVLGHALDSDRTNVRSDLVRTSRAQRCPPSDRAFRIGHWSRRDRDECLLIPYAGLAIQMR